MDVGVLISALIQYVNIDIKHILIMVFIIKNNAFYPLYTKFIYEINKMSNDIILTIKEIINFGYFPNMEQLENINKNHIKDLMILLNTFIYENLFADQNIIDVKCHGKLFNPKNNKILNNYIKINNGNHGSIYKFSTSNKYYYAIKITKNTYDFHLLTHNIQHPFIIKCYARYKKFIKSKYVLEYCYPIFDKYLKNNTTAKMVIVQLIFALTYLQNKFIMHGDLFPKNIVVGRNGYIKICDFGISRVYNNESEYILDIKKRIDKHKDCICFTEIIKTVNKEYFDHDFLHFLHDKNNTPIQYYKFIDLQKLNWVKFTNNNDEYYQHLVNKISK